jgi:hypothetical protein
MTPAELRALAKRVCEEQPSRELDAEIAKALGWERMNSSDLWWPGWLLAEARRRKRSIWSIGKQPVALPAYTTSLDAAASLMPEGWALMCAQFYPGMGALVQLHCTKPRGGFLGASAPTEPQARVAAALLARAADMEASDEAPHARP